MKRKQHYQPKNTVRIARTAGEHFEDEFQTAMFKALPSLEKTTEEVDKKEGADFLINQGEIRLDTTLDFTNKKFVPFVFDTQIPATSDQTFKIGIRIGNAHNGYTEFSKPVVVIGLDLDPYAYKMSESTIAQNLLTHRDELRNAIYDAHLDYTTLDKKEREETLFAEPLRPNPNYREPRAITDCMKKYNDMQYKIMENKEDFAYV